jgi:hypothetical protein
MHSAQDTGRPFTPTGPFDLDEILRDSLGIHTGGEVAHVEVRFQPGVARYVREQPGTKPSSSTPPPTAASASP